VAIVLGTTLFGLLTQLSGGMRTAALSMAGFFIVSLIVLAALRRSYDRALTG
jgi:MFS-type transporter involved in bile tolerance (Atg22 family)